MQESSLTGSFASANEPVRSRLRLQEQVGARLATNYVDRRRLGFAVPRLV